MPSFGVSTGYETLSVTTAAGFASIPAQANGDPACNAVMIRVTGNNALYRCDGVAPTTTNGMPINTADTGPIVLLGFSNIKNFQAIAATGTAVIHAIYFSLK